MADKDAAERGALGRTLSAGVWVSGTVVLAGLALSAAGRDGGRVVLAGLAVLIATPLLGLFVLGVRYAARGAYRWTALCAGLLALVAFSAFLGH